MYLLCLFLCYVSGVLCLQCNETDPCEHVYPCILGDVMAEPTNCTFYRQCVGPYEYVLTSSECGGHKGSFSNVTCKCNPTNECHEWKCPPSSITPEPPVRSEPCFQDGVECSMNNITIPDRYYCTKYFKCDDGDWVSQTCPEHVPYYDVDRSQETVPCANNVARCSSIEFDSCLNLTLEMTTMHLFTTRRDATTESASIQPTTSETSIIHTTTTEPTIIHTTTTEPTTIHTTTTEPTASLPTTSDTTTVKGTTSASSVNSTINTPTSREPTTTKTIAEDTTGTLHWTSGATDVGVNGTEATKITRGQSTLQVTDPRSSVACEALETCTPGQKVAHIYECSVFFQCVDGIWEEHNCEQIHSKKPVYNPMEQECQKKFMVDCAVRCNLDGIRLEKSTRNIVIIVMCCFAGIVAIIIIVVFSCKKTEEDNYDYKGLDSGLSGKSTNQVYNIGSPRSNDTLRSTDHMSPPLPSHSIPMGVQLVECASINKQTVDPLALAVPLPKRKSKINMLEERAALYRPTDIDDIRRGKGPNYTTTNRLYLESMADGPRPPPFGLMDL